MEGNIQSEPKYDSGQWLLAWGVPHIKWTKFKSLFIHSSTTEDPHITNLDQLPKKKE